MRMPSGGRALTIARQVWPHMGAAVEARHYATAMPRACRSATAGPVSTSEINAVIACCRPILTVQLAVGGDGAPAAAVAQQELVGLLGSRTAGGIDRQVARALLFPDAEYRLHDAPAGLDRIGALEQRGIACHAVVDQRFVACAGRGLENILVVELHVDALDADRGARNLHAEAQCDALVGLDVQREVVGWQAVDRRVAEKR